MTAFENTIFSPRTYSVVGVKYSTKGYLCSFTLYKTLLFPMYSVFISSSDFISSHFSFFIYFVMFFLYQFLHRLSFLVNYFVLIDSRLMVIL